MQKHKDIERIPVFEHARIYHGLHALDVFTRSGYYVGIVTPRFDYEAVSTVDSKITKVTICNVMIITFRMRSFSPSTTAALSGVLILIS